MTLNVDTDAVLLIDAENAFNSVNHPVMLRIYLPHHCYFYNQLSCNCINVIYCRWGRDTL